MTPNQNTANRLEYLSPTPVHLPHCNPSCHHASSPAAVGCHVLPILAVYTRAWTMCAHQSPLWSARWRRWWNLSALCYNGMGRHLGRSPCVPLSKRSQATWLMTFITLLKGLEFRSSEVIHLEHSTVPKPICKSVLTSRNCPLSASYEKLRQEMWNGIFTTNETKG